MWLPQSWVSNSLFVISEWSYMQFEISRYKPFKKIWLEIKRITEIWRLNKFLWPFRLQSSSFLHPFFFCQLDPYMRNASKIGNFSKLWHFALRGSSILGILKLWFQMRLANCWNPQIYDGSLFGCYDIFGSLILDFVVNFFVSKCIVVPFAIEITKCHEHRVVMFFKLLTFWSTDISDFEINVSLWNQT